MDSNGNELLSSQDVEEALSRTYVQAIAARAGYTTSEPDFDRDSVDLQIQSGGMARPALNFQLKATVNLTRDSSGLISFSLSRKNHNDLVIATQTPRLLVVLELPRSSIKWLTITPEHLMLKKCAYWVSLRGRCKTDQQSITVKIPEVNLFDVNALKSLMDQSRTGSIG